MSAHDPEVSALAKLFYDETLDLFEGGEVTRHKREGFEVPHEVWTAQADAISARLLRALDKALAAEVADVLATNDQACLHKVASALDEACAGLQMYVETATKLLLVLHARLSAAESIDEGEEGKEGE